MADSPLEAMRFPDTGQPIVYIRVATPDEVPSDVDVGAGPLYSVHDAEGNRLALAADRKLAFAVARQNDLVPMSVH